MMSGVLVFSLVPLATVVFRAAAPQLGWREAVVRAALGWGASVLVFTEALGAMHALNFGPVLAGWLLAHACLLGLWWRWRAGLARPAIPAGCWPLAVLPALALATALLAPPNTPDALSYHLPRQAMWLQQGSLDHFLTVNDRALMMPPLAEMMQAHALLLAGGDWFANLPQWFAYVVGLVVVSLIARDLGGGRKAQWLAALVFATVPMAWHEATGAKNDLLVAVWLAIATRYAVRLVGPGTRPVAEWLAAGVALGLALATKTTALVFCLPIFAVLGRAAWRAPRSAAVFAVAALLPVAPHAWRNFAWYGTPLGIHRAEDGGEQAVVAPTLQGTASNLVRNATLHLATPSPAANRNFFSAVARLHAWLGAEVNDPRTTLWVLHYGVDWGPRDEMIAGAPAQFLLGIAAMLALGLVGPRTREKMAVVAMVVGATLLYCVVLKWQPAGARLHLPAFVMLAPLVAVVAEGFGSRAIWLAAGACVLGWLPSLETSDRPLWSAPRLWERSRWENYFRFDPAEAARQDACVRALLVAKVSSLQIISRHGFPWPLMRRWQTEAGAGAKFWGALPESAHTPPNGVLVLDFIPHPPSLQPPNARERFVRVGATGPYALYLPESRVAMVRSMSALQSFSEPPVAAAISSALSR